MIALGYDAWRTSGPPSERCHECRERPPLDGRDLCATCAPRCDCGEPADGWADCAACVEGEA